MITTASNGLVWVFNESSLQEALDEDLAGNADAEERKAIILAFLNSEAAAHFGLRRMAMKPGE
jgi:hypothetical protein